VEVKRAGRYWNSGGVWLGVLNMGMEISTPVIPPVASGLPTICGYPGPRVWYSHQSDKHIALSFVPLPLWMRRAAGRDKPVTHIIERVEARYEAHEVAFGKVYEWHPAYVALECDCGEQLILTAASPITICRCGAHHTDFVHDIQERESHLPDRLTHPWFYDAQERARQRTRDEAAYPEGSPWRYNDITGDS
jgi:hypothetical protein